MCPYSCARPRELGRADRGDGSTAKREAATPAAELQLVHTAILHWSNRQCRPSRPMRTMASRSLRTLVG